MLWLKLHPYTTAALFTGFILLFGVAVVLEHASVAPTDAGQSEAWASNNAGYFSTPSVPSTSLTDSSSQLTSVETKTLNYISPFATTTGTLASNNTEGTAADLDALLATLSHPASARTENTTVKGTYDFIPSGLISVSNLEVNSPAMNDTATQRILRDYGNFVGSAILNFENLHPDQASVLKDHAEAPFDSTKVHALDQLGQDYVALGNSIAEIDPVPAQMLGVHKKLVASYRELGTKLSNVSKSPDDLYNAIEAYDASADQFAKDFIAFALLFPANGVKFMQGEAGSTFQFTGGGGL